MKHTKLPIHYDDRGLQNYPLLNSSGEYLAVVGAEANAAFIVKACNEYYPLIKILKGLVGKLDAEDWFIKVSENEGVCVETIKSIIAQVEAEK